MGSSQVVMRRKNSVPSSKAKSALRPTLKPAVADAGGGKAEASGVKRAVRKKPAVPAANKTGPEAGRKEKRPAAAPIAPGRESAFPLKDRFAIVGIGASAGGLEAILELLDHLPENPGFALVLVQHLDPRHKSLLRELLSRRTKLSVREITDGARVEIDHLYIIPPNRNLRIDHGRLVLGPRTLHRGQHMPVDVFLRSLAEEARSRAVAVILSGANTDGALGVEAIKGEGGIVFVQDESTAKYHEMPSAAIATGCVDFVLPPAAVARELARLDRHAYIHVADRLESAAEHGDAPAEKPGKDAPADIAVPEDDDAGDPRWRGATILTEQQRFQQDLRRLLLLLRNSVGVDFTNYKQATIQRRIMRRMALLRFDKLNDYARFLRNNENELLALYQDLLIKVTSFFRDPAAFDYLRKRIFPRLFKDRSPDDPVRVWVPGCATGEEAYSLAITFLEFLGRRRNEYQVQIFATDLSEPSLDRAREGEYIENIALDVPSERLKRFFTRHGRSYRIAKPVREMIIFARQNLVKDPPFSRLDLVSCRNVLIYLGQPLQRRIFPVFHYALRPGGFLTPRQFRKRRRVSEFVCGRGQENPDLPASRHRAAGAGSADRSDALLPALAGLRSARNLRPETRWSKGCQSRAENP